LPYKKQAIILFFNECIQGKNIMKIPPAKPSQTSAQLQQDVVAIGPSQRIKKARHWLMYLALAAVSTLSSTLMLANAPLPEYRIKARALDQMLTQFSTQTGLHIEMDAQQLAAVRKTECLHGRYSVDQAMSKLMENTPYQALKTSQGYRIVPK
jgi:hypothetical protein